MKEILKFYWRLWRDKPFREPGRLGELKKVENIDFVFCPLMNEWIGLTPCYDISGDRESSDKLDYADTNNLKVGYNAFRDAVKKSKKNFSGGFKEAVLTCRFCEAYCYGNKNGPSEIPPIENIDSEKLLSDLYRREPN